MGRCRIHAHALVQIGLDPSSVNLVKAHTVRQTLAWAAGLTASHKLPKLDAEKAVVLGHSAGAAAVCIALQHLILASECLHLAHGFRIMLVARGSIRMLFLLSLQILNASTWCIGILMCMVRNA